MDDDGVDVDAMIEDLYARHDGFEMFEARTEDGKACLVIAPLTPAGWKALAGMLDDLLSFIERRTQEN